VATALLWAAFALGAHPSRSTLLVATLAAIVVVVIVGVPAATIAEREAGRTDPGFVVIDEVAGQLIALLFCPPDWAHALIALILFRLLDITKPFPIRRIERLPAGWGIVFDDVGAGLYALIVASLVRIWY
jgi:phosphatidylglycerophosphatase A